MMPFYVAITELYEMSALLFCMFSWGTMSIKHAFWEILIELSYLFISSSY
jgi:hypothetical protein